MWIDGKRLSGGLLSFECVSCLFNGCLYFRFGGRSLDGQRIPGCTGFGGIDTGNLFYGSYNSRLAVAAMHALDAIDHRIRIGLLVGEFTEQFHTKGK